MVDRFKTKQKDDDYVQRVTNSIETALYDGNGECWIVYSDKNSEVKIRSFSDKFEADGIEFEIPTPDLFSFNSPYGACPKCQGFGNVMGYDEDLVIPDRTLSVYQNAVVCWKGEKMQEWKNYLIENSSKDNFPIHKPIAELSDKEYEMLWEGTDNFYGINDFFDYLESKAYKIQYRVMTSRFRGKSICPDCKGKRLRPEAYYVKFKDKTINDIVTTPINELLDYFQNLVLDEKEEIIAGRILKEIKQRLSFLYSVGLEYLTLNRTTNTLSGGELQRINLSTSLGSNLSGSMYILDEPSVGLHSSDTNRLIDALFNLRDLGNTVIVVEHDEDIIRAADYVIDIGPYAGRLGGEVMFAGTVNELLKADSLTAKYLRGELSVPISNKKRKVRNKITIIGARQFNLKNITVDFPLNMLTVIIGVSGSGKSTLVNEILYPALKRNFNDLSFKPGKYSKLTGDLSAISDVELIDQNSITRSSRSNPVTYIGAFDDIRKLFSQQKLSELRGYKPGTFSYNVAGGRCEECEGEGYITVEMQFLADVKLVCEECGGKRYKEEVLDITYQNKNIFDILDLTIDDALDLFSKGKSALEKKIVTKLKLLTDVGLGYIKMGQSLSTLSSGEAQRVKLATFLSKAETDKPKLFIFDEPTTGLHFHDIAKLLKSFNALIENGHSIIVIEHNNEIIKAADYIIELGPKGGSLGGYLIRGETAK
jgi:excinuclease ABC subunit A